MRQSSCIDEMKMFLLSFVTIDANTKRTTSLNVIDPKLRSFFWSFYARNMLEIVPWTRHNHCILWYNLFYNHKKEICTLSIKRTFIHGISFTHFVRRLSKSVFRSTSRSNILISYLSTLETIHACQTAIPCIRTLDFNNNMFRRCQSSFSIILSILVDVLFYYNIIWWCFFHIMQNLESILFLWWYSCLIQYI